MPAPPNHHVGYLTLAQERKERKDMDEDTLYRIAIYLAEGYLRGGDELTIEEMAQELRHLGRTSLGGLSALAAYAARGGLTT
jgi:hypothetical protein